MSKDIVRPQIVSLDGSPVDIPPAGSAKKEESPWLHPYPLPTGENVPWRK